MFSMGYRLTSEFFSNPLSIDLEGELVMITTSSPFLILLRHIFGMLVNSARFS